MENEIDRESILNWRDSNVASPEVRQAYVDAALAMWQDDSTQLTVAELSEILGVEDRALRQWLRDRKIKLNTAGPGPDGRRHAGGSGDVDLTAALEEMRQQKVRDVRERYADEIARAELA